MDADSGDVDGVFRTFASKLGVPVDQIYFFAAQAFCLMSAVLFRNFLPASESSTKLRHVVELCLGVCVGLFCFGNEFFHVILQSVICFIGIRLLPPALMPNVVFILAMSYMVLIHLHRTFMTPEDVLYQLDVSGPVMVATQKITCLAFSLSDGRQSAKENLSDLRRKHVLHEKPSTIEYFSYMFYFQAVLVGPLCFFNDYKSFIEGTDIKRSHHDSPQNNNKPFPKTKDLSPFEPVSRKLSITVFWLLFHMIMKPQFPETLNSDAQFVKTYGILYRTWYMVVSMLTCRAKYYVAFSLGDAVCNASGFGFNGYDSHGLPKWDLCTNVNILGIEAATSPKLYIDNWNIQTAVWLRHVCYERVKFQKRLLTFLLSALWHGLYPGYYFTFLFGAFFSDIARIMRRKFRPYFVNKSGVKRGYDILTWLLTQLGMSYMATPFTVLYFTQTIMFYNNFYWCFHVLLLILYIVLPFVPTPKTGTSSKDDSIKANSGTESIKANSGTESIKANSGTESIKANNGTGFQSEQQRLVKQE